jgi:uncharacterized protein (DUF302 family)
MIKKTKFNLLFFLLFFSSSLIANSINTTIIKSDYKNVRSNILDSIEEKALNIANVYHASEMLNRTKGIFSFGRNIYKNAEIIEFCSAKISHEMARANHLNILLCPFKIAIYTLNSNPENTYVIYSVPDPIDENSKKSMAKVTALIRSIVESAAW